MVSANKAGKVNNDIFYLYCESNALPTKRGIGRDREDKNLAPGERSPKWLSGVFAIMLYNVLTTESQSGI